MNNIQGYVPINEHLTSQEKSVVEPVSIPLLEPSKFIAKKIDIDGKTLIKNILFICDKCEGPLVPASNCIVCKRTLLRKCTSCGNQLQNSPHESCEYLVLMGKLRSNFPFSNK